MKPGENSCTAAAIRSGREAVSDEFVEAWEAAHGALLGAASAYADACDAGQYPKLALLVKELKLAARRLRWLEKGIDGDPRRGKK